MGNPNVNVDQMLDKLSNIKGMENTDISSKGSDSKSRLEVNVVSTVNGLLSKDSLTPQQVDLLRVLLPYTR